MNLSKSIDKYSSFRVFSDL